MEQTREDMRSWLRRDARFTIGREKKWAGMKGAQTETGAPTEGKEPNSKHPQPGLCQGGIKNRRERG